MAAQEILRDERVLTEIAFRRLLDWLDDGVESNGDAYLEIRRRLVAYFDRRDRPMSDDLADETLNRVARALEAGPIRITPPARYCYIVARFVMLEDVRRERTERRADSSASAGALHLQGRIPKPDDAQVAAEQRLDCLDRCLAQLRPEQRELVIEYYKDSGRQKIDRRRELAERLGISMNALGIRACRIRDTLEACVAGCCQVDARKK